MATDYPYSINYAVAYGSLKLIDLDKIRSKVTEEWFNQTLCEVNDSVIRLGVVCGEFHWHKHDKEDEFFYVVDGTLFIDLEDQVVELKPRQGFTVPRGVLHRTRAPERTAILMVEPKSVVATGD
jgi:mannose-6-phosphate isomerase-like protein (cupin superfamily)